MNLGMLNFPFFALTTYTNAACIVYINIKYKAVPCDPSRMILYVRALQGV